MTWKLLQLAFPLVFLFVAFYQYAKNRAVLIGFREQLAVSPKGRRFVVLTTLLLLLAYHFIALCGTGSPVLLLPSSILSFILFSQRYAEKIFRLYHDRERMLCIVTVILGTTICPYTFSIAVTLLVLLIASWVYPTEELIQEMSVRDDTHDIVEETVSGMFEQLGKTYESVVFNPITSPAEAVEEEAVPLVEEPSPQEDVEEKVEVSSVSNKRTSGKEKLSRLFRAKARVRRQSRAKRKARRKRHRR